MTKHIYLVGFMGSGKSTVGPLVAQKTGRPFYDLDKLIEEKKEMTISNIFESRGEQFFRELESQCLYEAQSLTPYVMALGGGAFQSEVNRKLLAKQGLTVWIKAPFDLIKERCSKKTHRPLAKDPMRLKTLFDLRKKHYRTADIQVNVMLKSPQQICDEILQELATLPE